MTKYEFSKEYKILIILFLFLVSTASIPPYDSYRHAIIPFFAVYTWYQILSTPYKVIFSESNFIIFQFFLKTKVLNPSDITKIEDSMFGYKILHKDGSLKVSTLMYDAYGLKRAIESANIDIETEDLQLSKIQELEKRNPLIMFAYVLMFSVLSIFIRFFLFTR
jgi:hypothetical protein